MIRLRTKIITVIVVLALGGLYINKPKPALAISAIPKVGTEIVNGEETTVRVVIPESSISKNAKIVVHNREIRGNETQIGVVENVKSGQTVEIPWTPDVSSDETDTHYVLLVTIIQKDVPEVHESETFEIKDPYTESIE